MLGKKRLYLGIILLSTTVLSFQNCSKVEFADHDLLEKMDGFHIGVAGGDRDFDYDNHLIGTGSPTVAWTATTGVSYYDVSILSGGTEICPKERTTENSVQFSCVLEDGKDYTVLLTPYFGEGNKGAVRSLDFAVNQQGPVINLTREDVQANSYAINYSIQDADDIVKSATCELVGSAVPVFDCKDLNSYVFEGLQSGTPYELRIIAEDSFGNQSTLIKPVNTAFLNFSPSIATRDAACITCHLRMDKADFVTDFGYGNNYFFGKAANKRYSDFDHKSWLTTHFTANTKVIVPRNAVLNLTESNMIAPASTLTPGQVAAIQAVQAVALTPGQTLVEYIRGVEALKPQYASAYGIVNEQTQARDVVDKGTVYIGAPTAHDIELAAPRINQAGIQFFDANNIEQSAPSGGVWVSSTGIYKAVNTTLKCNGSLFVKGTVFLSNVTVETDTGCRIYGTGSIFVQGAIRMVDTNVNQNIDTSNLQLISATSISMGIGLTHCETEADNRYVKNCALYPNSNGCSPLKSRFMGWITPTREYSSTEKTPLMLGELIVAQGQAIPELKDASCEIGGREISFDRLLLNAPLVHSRYTGQFSGMIIAESMVMALGKFNYKFDDVFKRVPLLTPGKIDFGQKSLRVQ